ncbi:peroxiredoxin family protein [Pollutimonas harenae]|uniref:TlpA family protein disulfide reductase n=1 Tax=Pollutimonas harenae TaxID=657015 RepID=A0A853H2F6_9BURK|nr:TlpA disulfide reductase family protein [Pollutimonas harenae]NYT85989.1 TlpA family protein disulfide reductase [Pollutimonas harenae]TEA71038.1 TlpA family protein disulfide reductase [Pollutimonas harenae]
MNPVVYQQAPSWSVSQWMNTRDEHISLEALRGLVVVLHAFQMLCPACVSHGIPQAKSIHMAFPLDKVRVIGLHTVFEHHDAMGPVALAAFMHEYRLGFPVAIDQADEHSPIPKTMQAYGMQGTPTLVLIDKAGHIRLHHFGSLDDLHVGAAIGQLLTEEV